MRELGFDVAGIDASAGQVRLRPPRRRRGLVVEGSALQIPAADASYDFVYTINVLHHLSSVDEQRRAFGRLLRVLRPGGVLFVHEINTRNVLFRFYMGYVFPSLNCIDEGVERWLLPHRLEVYTDELAAVDVRYFTFLPDFLPAAVVRLLTPIERWLERSPLARVLGPLHGRAAEAVMKRHGGSSLACVVRRSQSPSGSCRLRSISSSGRLERRIGWRTCRRSPSLLALRWRARGAAGRAASRPGAGLRRLARVASSAAPLWLFWLWTVPYLPWLPDRLPLLLVLAGPVRWVIAASP